MSRSMLRVAAVAFVAAIIPAVSGAQTINCARIGGVGGTCPAAVQASFTVPSVHRLSMPDVIALEEPTSWETFFQGSTLDSTFTEIALTFRSNTTTAFGVSVSTPALLGGTAALVAGNNRVVSDYAWKLISGATCDAGGYTPLAATATASIPSVDLPTSGPQNGSTRTFCVRSIYDPADLTKLRAGTYQLDLTFAITAP